MRELTTEQIAEQKPRIVLLCVDDVEYLTSVISEVSAKLAREEISSQLLMESLSFSKADRDGIISSQKLGMESDKSLLQMNYRDVIDPVTGEIHNIYSPQGQDIYSSKINRIYNAKSRQVKNALRAKKKRNDPEPYHHLTARTDSLLFLISNMIQSRLVSSEHYLLNPIVVDLKLIERYAYNYNRIRVLTLSTKTNPGNFSRNLATYYEHLGDFLKSHFLIGKQIADYIHQQSEQDNCNLAALKYETYTIVKHYLVESNIEFSEHTQIPEDLVLIEGNLSQKVINSSFIATSPETWNGTAVIRDLCIDEEFRDLMDDYFIYIFLMTAFFSPNTGRSPELAEKFGYEALDKIVKKMFRSIKKYGSTRVLARCQKGETLENVIEEITGILVFDDKSINRYIWQKGLKNEP